MKGKANKANSVNEGNFLDTSKCYCSFSPSLVSRDEIELSFKLKKMLLLTYFNPVTISHSLRNLLWHIVQRQKCISKIWNIMEKFIFIP